jgi:hypothetical protein
LLLEFLQTTRHLRICKAPAQRLTTAHGTPVAAAERTEWAGSTPARIGTVPGFFPRFGSFTFLLFDAPFQRANPLFRGFQVLLGLRHLTAGLLQLPTQLITNGCVPTRSLV